VFGGELDLGIFGLVILCFVLGMELDWIRLSWFGGLGEGYRGDRYG